MVKNLVIVESPAKAKTIEGFLGKDFLVKSSNGHVRDLAKKEMGIDISNHFCPNYQILPDKKKIISELKKLSGEAETVWLATDEDREGEAISWHLSEALKLESKKVKRITFHEITKSAILNAIASPREINKNLVDAQQARRVLDRLVGFNLSPVLWKKVKPSLSAGRVQSVAVRLIVEREREIAQFNITSDYKVVAHFSASNNEGNRVAFKAILPKRFKTKAEAVKFLQQLVNADYKVEKTEKKPAIQSSSAPFTTSTLQQEASRKLGFSVSQTMSVAQQLYESGKITYMRTDSVQLSDTAIQAAKNEIIRRFGSEYANPKQYVTKSKSAQEAHEAIRPTHLDQPLIQSENDRANRLYALIWKRTIASQMANAELEKTIVTITPSTSADKFIANGEVILFDGFLKVYFESTDDDEIDIHSSATEEESQAILPPLSVGQNVGVNEIHAIERFSKPSVRYSEASLVKKMEQLGIGRPSTYAPTISTIQKRGYVVRENRQGSKRNFVIITLKKSNITEKTESENVGFEKGKLFPTDIGTIVNDFLLSHFNNIMDYHFTASVEKEFDDIAQGQKKWNKMIDDFYGPFHKNVEDTIKTSEKATGKRLLGIDPETQKNVYVKIGRFGPVVQIGEGDEEKPKFTSLKTGQSIETITLEEALALFNLPREAGIYNNMGIIVANGRFGAYIKHDNKNYSLKRTDDPYTLTLERAIEIIKEKTPIALGDFEGKEIVAAVGKFGPYVKHDDKYYSLPKKDIFLTIDNKTAIEIIKQKRNAEKQKIIKTFNENTNIQILQGKYGPYIKIGKKNLKLPKDKSPEEMTLEECLAIDKQTSSLKTAKKKK